MLDADLHVYRDLHLVAHAGILYRRRRGRQDRGAMAPCLFYEFADILDGSLRDELVTFVPYGTSYLASMGPMLLFHDFRYVLLSPFACGNGPYFMTCVLALQRTWRRVRRGRVLLALAMSAHPRLGRCSVLGTLPDHILEHIAVSL